MIKFLFILAIFLGSYSVIFSVLKALGDKLSDLAQKEQITIKPEDILAKETEINTPVVEATSIDVPDTSDTPIDALSVVRSLNTDVVNVKKNKKLVSSIVALTKSLGYSVVVAPTVEKRTVKKK